MNTSYKFIKDHIYNLEIVILHMFSSSVLYWFEYLTNYFSGYIIVNNLTFTMLAYIEVDNLLRVVGYHMMSL